MSTRLESIVAEITSVFPECTSLIRHAVQAGLHGCLYEMPVWTGPSQTREDWVTAYTRAVTVRALYWAEVYRLQDEDAEWFAETQTHDGA